MCPPMRALWRHLANTIELVHPSAELSPPPKRQIDRFSRFCTAHDRKCLYFTMGAPIHQNCPFAWVIWTPYLTHDSCAHASPNTNGTSIGSAVLHRWLQSIPILYNGSPVSPSKLSLLMGYPGIWTPCNTFQPAVRRHWYFAIPCVLKL